MPLTKTGLLMYVFCCRPVHGLIFLFKWQPGEEPAGSIVQDSRLDHIFFAKQVKKYVLGSPLKGTVCFQEPGIMSNIRSSSLFKVRLYHVVVLIANREMKWLCKGHSFIAHISSTKLVNECDNKLLLF